MIISPGCYKLEYSRDRVDLVHMFRMGEYLFGASACRCTLPSLHVLAEQCSFYSASLHLVQTAKHCKNQDILFCGSCVLIVAGAETAGATSMGARLHAHVRHSGRLHDSTPAALLENPRHQLLLLRQPSTPAACHQFWYNFQHLAHSRASCSCVMVAQRALLTPRQSKRHSDCRLPCLKHVMH